MTGRSTVLQHPPRCRCNAFESAQSGDCRSGENSYLAEVENLLVDFPGAAESAVVGLSDEHWGEVPVLALRLAPGLADVDNAVLQALFDARLARYKIRATWRCSGRG